jgi:hypothetical protein
MESKTGFHEIGFREGKGEGVISFFPSTSGISEYGQEVN